MQLDIDFPSGRLPAQRALRLDTLMRLRWLGLAGQTLAMVGVHMLPGFELPLVAGLAVIAFSALLNAALRVGFHGGMRLGGSSAGLLLGFDVVQLAALLYLTGGMQNPFAVLFLAPVMISATALPPRVTLALGALVVACASVLVFVHLPLPWPPPDAVRLPMLYVGGVWAALVVALAFIGVYAWRVAKEGRELAQALAATELVLAREQHLSALDGLAAAAAHELGTPLATIALVAKELERAITPGPHDDDVALLREQVGRCRDILKKLTSLDERGAPYAVMDVDHLIEEIVAPHRNFGVTLDVYATGPDPEPRWVRNPSVLYGLGNIVENAVDFASSRVDVTARWDLDRVEIVIADDGSGFSPEILSRLGEPYVSSRSDERQVVGEGGGLGLGFFIAKTLLERSGARLILGNRAQPATGARVQIIWPRFRFDQPKPPLGRSATPAEGAAVA